MRHAATLLGVLLLAAIPAASAQEAKRPAGNEIKFVLPATVEPGQLTRIDIAGTTPAQLPSLILDAWPDNCQTMPAKTWQDEPYLWFVAPKGRYRLALAYVSDGKPAMARAIVQVGTTPAPTPNPTPQPDPGPTPTPDPTPEPGPTPEPPDPDGAAKNPHTPAETYKAAAAPIAKFRMSRTDGTKLANLYAGVARDCRAHAIPTPQTITPDGGCPSGNCGQSFFWQTPQAAGATTADLCALIVDRGKTLGIKGKYPGLAAAIDKAFADTVGLAVAALDYDQAAKFLDTLAWAAWEAGRPRSAAR